MKPTGLSKRVLVILAAVAGLFLLARGLWVGIEALTGRIQLDRRDWMMVLLFALAGIRLMLYVVATIRKTT